jgi:Flp pilus assembly protein TadB
MSQEKWTAVHRLPPGCARAGDRRRLRAVLALRIAFTAVVMVIVVVLLATGNPVGGLLIVPSLAVWIRRGAESGRLTRFARRS